MVGSREYRRADGPEPATKNGGDFQTQIEDDHRTNLENSQVEEYQ